MKKQFNCAAFVLLAMLLIPAGKAYAAESDARKIANGVYIGSVNVSGMSVTDAETAVSQFVDEVSAEAITLSAGEGRETSFTGEDIGLYWSNTSIVEDAYALGHQGNIIKRYKALKDLEKNNYTFDIEYG